VRVKAGTRGKDVEGNPDHGQGRVTRPERASQTRSNSLSWMMKRANALPPELPGSTTQALKNWQR
jgi:hypothetical protein